MFLTVLMNCNSSKNIPEKQPFAIETATYQNWYGGREGVRGVNIKIRMATKQFNVTFLVIYYLNKHSAINTKLLKDRIELTANINTSNRNERILNANPRNEYGNKAPKQLKYPDLKENEAVLEYKLNDKLAFIKITLKKEKDLFYQ